MISSILSGRLVSLDIGSSAIRVVELKTSKNGQSVLVNHGSIAIPANVDGGTYSDVPDDIIVESIKQAMKQAGISNKDVCIGVPTSKTFSVIVDLPKIQKREEQEKVIPIQAEEHMPNAIDTIDLDWHILGDSQTEQNKMEVMLTSVEKTYNLRKIDLAEKAGLNVISVEPDAYALAKSLIKYGDKSPHIILDTGNIQTDLVIVIDGNPKLIRAIPVGIQHLVNAIASGLSVDMTEAQQYLYKFGFLSDQLEGKVYSAVEPVLKGVTDELQKSIKFIESRYGQTQFSDILVSGFTSYIPGLSEHIQEIFKVPTVPGSSWTNVTLGQEHQKDLVNQGNTFPVAIGLARRLDD